jgi:hypothetical protein
MANDLAFASYALFVFLGVSNVRRFLARQHREILTPDLKWKSAKSRARKVQYGSYAERTWKRIIIAFTSVTGDSQIDPQNLDNAPESTSGEATYERFPSLPNGRLAD